jgi:hypothetical protein
MADRITIDVEGLREAIANARPDAAWKALSLSKKTRILLEERLLQIHNGVMPIPDEPKLPSFPDLLKNQNLRKLAEDAEIPVENLEAIINGSRPSDDDIIGLGQALTDYDTADLLRIRQRDFSTAENGSSKHE